jgi:hypothetical protein
MAAEPLTVIVIALILNDHRLKAVVLNLAHGK